MSARALSQNRSIKDKIVSKKEDILERAFYDRRLEFFMVYDRIHKKKYYMDDSYEKDKKILSLFKKYPELTNVEIFGAFGTYLKRDRLTFYTGIVVRSKIGPFTVRDANTRRVGKGSLEDFYRFTDAV